MVLNFLQKLALVLKILEMKILFQSRILLQKYLMLKSLTPNNSGSNSTQPIFAKVVKGKDIQQAITDPLADEY